MARSTKGPKSDPAVTLRRNQVRSLVHVGFSNAMIAEVLNITEQTVSNDKRLWGLTSPDNLFRCRLVLWMSLMTKELAEVLPQNLFDADLAERVHDYLTQAIVREVSEALGPLFEPVIRPAIEDGTPYEWLFMSHQLYLLPRMEAMILRALRKVEYGSISDPYEIEQHVMRSIQADPSYRERMAQRARGDSGHWVQTPAAFRDAIDGLRREHGEIGALWDEWMERCELLRPDRLVHMRPLKRDLLHRRELRARTQLRDSMLLVDVGLRHFYLWRAHGPLRMAEETANREQGLARLSIERTNLLTAFNKANDQLSNAGLEPVGLEATISVSDLAPWLKSLREIDWSVRTGNCLENQRLNYIWQLVEKSEADMLKTKNFGRKSLNEVKKILAELGFTLGMKIPRELREVLKLRSGVTN